MTRQRANDVLALIVAAVATIAVFAPWHDVHDGGFGEAIACTFQPDCHAHPVPRDVILRSPPRAVHTGLDHGGVVYLIVLAIYVVLRVQSLRSPKRGRVVVLAVLGLLLGAAFALEADLGGLSHLFDVTRERWGHSVVRVLGPLLAVVALGDIWAAATWRKRLPAARVVSS